MKSAEYNPLPWHMACIERYMYYVFSLIMHLNKNGMWSLANKFLKELAVNLWNFKIYFFGLPRLVQKDQQACQEKGLWRNWWVTPVHFQSHVLVCSFDTWWKWQSHTRKMENTTITHSKHSCQCREWPVSWMWAWQPARRCSWLALAATRYSNCYVIHSIVIWSTKFTIIWFHIS